ncbi:response regulator [Leptolyngbya sp. 7M]|nr:response regulator [Leptolyngbya sp. 7M]
MKKVINYFLDQQTPTVSLTSPIIVLRQGPQVVALAVDRILTEQELIIKPFGSAIAPPNYVYGCTILGDGSPIPVIDVATLVTFQTSDSLPTSATHALLEVRQASYDQPPSLLPTIQAPTILVVDDAVTLRRTLALFLEREGFRVVQAQDGQEALSQLQQNPSVQLILCDIEMPNMNGFEFLNHRRQSPDLTDIPTVILTSRSNEKHRWLAMQLGATAYFTKPYLEQDLLSTLKTLLKMS